MAGVSRLECSGGHCGGTEKEMVTYDLPMISGGCEGVEEGRSDSHAREQVSQRSGLIL